MKRFKALLGVLLLVGVIVSSAVPIKVNAAATIVAETFTGTSTPANSWISGGGDTVACLTAATSSASNSIPACVEGPYDDVGDGALRLTDASNSQSGFAFYNTPISAAEGLQIEFDMYQYGGTGADGISFFLIDGAASPTQPGALGGSLGYASSTITPGLVGGYVGVGFDRFGNWSNSNVGGGGPGPYANQIGVRGSEATDYDYVTGVHASGMLSNEDTNDRSEARRHVVITISTNNIMGVSVDYGEGLVKELSNIDLNTINGEGSLPANFKFGFAASTGGSNNIHEIRGLTVDPLKPYVSVNLSHGAGFIQGGTNYYNMVVSNSAEAEATTGDITASATFPSGITPTAVSGTGWSCNISGQDVSCTRPGSGGNALAPGQNAPTIRVDVSIANNSSTPKVATASVTTTDNNNPDPTDSDSVTVANGSSDDTDGVFNAEEAASPNGGDANGDGDQDSEQDNVTSLVNVLTNNYTVLASDGDCTGNSDVSVADTSDLNVIDGSFTYPAGLMNFSLACGNPGESATVSMYYYGNLDAANLVARKYNSITQTYTDIPNAVITNVTIGGQKAVKIVYDITDGGLLDQDGVADGTIVDPAGPAIKNVSLAAPSTGLGQLPGFMYMVAGVTGIGILAYEVRSYRAYIKGKA